MNKFLHKISFLVALLLVSCSEDPDAMNNVVIGSSSEISLSAGVVETRATELTSDDFTSFGLYTYYSSGDLYFNETVTRDPSSGSCSFTATEPYEWPDDTLWFYGYYPCVYSYYPYDSLAPEKDDDGDVYIEYTSAADYEKQADFVVASKSSDATSSVHLEFDHALSKLNFTLTLDNSEVNIQNVELYYSYKQLVTTANYYFKSATWGDLGDAGYSSEYHFASYNNDASNPTHTFDESLFMIPQAVGEWGYLSVRVEYDMYNGDNFNHTVQTGNLALFSNESLGTVLVDKWEASTEYTYNLSINTKNEISFSLSVDERDDIVAQGNIDLQYISSYYDVTDRIATLWADGVNDLVIAGEYSSGALGYGSVSCPFITGFGDEYVITYREAVEGETATHVYDSETGKYSYATDEQTATHVIEDGYYKYDNEGDSEDDPTLFSVDFRLMTNLPSFTEMHGGEPENTGDEITDIDGEAPSFPKYIFQYAERLSEVILPEDVIAIGDYAFQGCEYLGKINMFGAKHVEKCAFQGCERLEEVVTTGTAGTLTRIHDNGFDGCTALKTIDLGNIRAIDQYGFVNCESLGVTDLSNVTIVGIHAFDGCTNLDIPAGTDIPNLETISDYAFAKCATLGHNTDIVINQAVTIGNYAFNGCSELHLGDDVTEYDLSVVEWIGKYAFQECKKIEKLDISNVTYVGPSAFYSCENLTLANNFTFSNLTHIGESAFQSCSVLCSESPITITASKIETLGSMAFWRCSDFDFEGTDTQVFSSVTSVEPGIFGYCEKLNNPIEFTNPAVTSIGEESFVGCTLLPSVKIPIENITSIDNKAFYSCTAMTDFEFDPTIITYLGEAAFYNSAELELNDGGELNFSKIDRVYENTFYGCESMTNSLVFSDNLTWIDAFAFAYSGFTSITGLDKVSYLGQKVFENCSSLTGTLSLPSLPSLYGQWNTFYGCTSLTSIELGLIEGGTIGGGTFQYCANLTSITGLDYVTEVPAYCFSGCTSLPSLYLPLATTIDNTALSNCTKLASLNANSLEGELDNALLSSCKTSLTSLSINSITKLGYQAFNGFSNLVTIELDGVSTLNYGVFYGCTSLKELSLPSFEGALDCNRLLQGVTTDEIANYALITLDLPLVTAISNATDFLAGMPNLTTLSLPSLSSTSYGTFAGLTALTYLDLSCAELNMVVSDGTMIFGGSAPADSQCTLVLNEKYKTESDDYTYIAANESGGYTDVTWMGVVWKEVLFVE
ncbi:MAG: leucine-rich repeat protein [Rikenellaceae bacterium]